MGSRFVENNHPVSDLLSSPCEGGGAGLSDCVVGAGLAAADCDLLGAGLPADDAGLLPPDFFKLTRDSTLGIFIE